MKVLRGLAQYYVDLMMKLGLVRFSLLLASALVVLAMIMQMAVTIFLRGHVDSLDMVGSIFFGLIITPLAVYFCPWWLSNLRNLGSVYREWLINLKL